MNESATTISYMVWGYVVTAALYGAYAAYLLVQKRRLERGDDVSPR